MNLSIAAKLGLPALALAAALVACPGPDPVVDTTAPKILTVSPTGSAVAVATNKISVNFDEEMDPSVLTGVISFTVPATGAPTVSAPVWSNGNKTYSVTLSALTAPTSYKFKVAGTVKDKAGNKYVQPTGAAGEYSFSTVVTTNTGLQPTVDAANVNGYYKPDTSALVGPTGVAGIRVGYTVGALGAPDGIGKAFYSFNLPANLTVAKIKSAKLTLVNTPTVAEGANGDGTNVFGIGNIRIESIVFAAANLGAADFASAGSSPVNIAALSGLANMDVTAAVKADVTALRAKSQFRASLVEPAAKPATGAWLRLGSATAPAANQPTLVIEYNP
jgi:Bacterial Ig-like domain